MAFPCHEATQVREPAHEPIVGIQMALWQPADSGTLGPLKETALAGPVSNPTWGSCGRGAAPGEA